MNLTNQRSHAGICKRNNLKPELYTSLGLEQAKREVEELEIKSSQPGFWDNPEESQKIVSPHGLAQGQG